MINLSSGEYITAYSIHKEFSDDISFIMATRAGTVKRIFITGILPVLLNDMSSGFNISVSVTHDESFNANNVLIDIWNLIF